MLLLYGNFGEVFRFWEIRDFYPEFRMCSFHRTKAAFERLKSALGHFLSSILSPIGIIFREIRYFARNSFESAFDEGFESSVNLD